MDIGQDIQINRPVLIYRSLPLKITIESWVVFSNKTTERIIYRDIMEEMVRGKGRARIKNWDEVDARSIDYIEHFEESLPEGIECLLDNPNDPNEWYSLIDNAIKEDEELPLCEGVFD